MKGTQEISQAAVKRFGKGEEHSLERVAFFAGYIDAIEETQDLFDALKALNECHAKVRTPNAEFMGTVQQVIDEYNRVLKHD